jgi:hypothetical protein
MWGKTGRKERDGQTNPRQQAGAAVGQTFSFALRKVSTKNLAEVFL